MYVCWCSLLAIITCVELTLALSFISSSNDPSPTTAALRDALADDSGVVVDLAPPAATRPEEAEAEDEPARGVLSTNALRRSAAVLALAPADEAAASSSGASWPAVSGCWWWWLMLVVTVGK